MQIFSVTQVLQKGSKFMNGNHGPVTSVLKKFHVSSAAPETLFHQIEGKSSGKDREVAYHKTDGPRPHGVIYIPGLMSDKSGIKSSKLHLFCQNYGFPYIRYDPSGLGETKGLKRTEARMSLWVEDAREMLVKLSDGPQIVVASSMGCWISCLLAKEHPEKFAGIVMLAPAFNFGEKYEKVLREQLPPKLLKKFEDGGVVNLFVSDYGEFPLSKAQFNDMNQFNCTMAEKNIPVVCPVRIIHGIEDNDVPYMESLQLLPALQTDDVHLTYIKNAGHRLIEDVSIEVMFDTVLKLASDLQPQNDSS